MANMPSMKKKYVEEVAPALMTKFQYESVMQIPKFDKIVINVGCGEAKDNSKVVDAIMTDLATITGQKPVECKAKKSVANFKLREGMTIGVKVTLRGDRMFEFMDTLFREFVTSEESTATLSTAEATMLWVLKSSSYSPKSSTIR